MRRRTQARSEALTDAHFRRQLIAVIALGFVFGVIAAALAGCSCPSAAPTRTFCDDVEKLLSVSAPAAGVSATRWAKDVALVTSNARTIKELHR